MRNNLTLLHPMHGCHLYIEVMCWHWVVRRSWVCPPYTGQSLLCLGGRGRLAWSWAAGKPRI
jgi:hypothetical protein